MYRPQEAREDTVIFPAFRDVVPKKELEELGEKFEDGEHARFGERGFERELDKRVRPRRELSSAIAPSTSCVEPREGTGHRHERVKALILEELRSLLRDDVSDPRLDGVTITSLVLSVDSRHARAPFAIPTGAARRDVERGLERRRRFCARGSRRRSR